MRGHERETQGKSAPEQQQLVQAFVDATASILKHSPCREYFLALGRCADPTLKCILLDDQL